jgi:hypothetical protein
MTREEMIRMAQEAGWEYATDDRGFEPLWRFAALVAAAEREACARVCESLSLEWEDQPDIAQAELATMMDCALAVRARSQA